MSKHCRMGTLGLALLAAATMPALARADNGAIGPSGPGAGDPTRKTG